MAATVHADLTFERPNFTQHTPVLAPEIRPNMLREMQQGRRRSAEESDQSLIYAVRMLPEIRMGTLPLHTQHSARTRCMCLLQDHRHVDFKDFPAPLSILKQPHRTLPVNTG